MHKVHFLVGVNLTGGIPLVEWVEHLGLLGKTAGQLLLVMESYTSPVELTGMFTFLTALPYLSKAVKLDCSLAKLVALVLRALK